MKQIIGNMLSLVALSSFANAEVFTTQKQEIKYTLSTDKPLNFKFTLKSAKKENCEIEFTLLDNKNKTLLFDKYSRKESQKIYNVPVNSGKYLLKMKNYSHNAFCVDKPFDLSLSKITGNYEIEPNNSNINPTSLIESKYFTGYLQSQYGQNKDTDFYKIDIPKDGKMTLAFKNEKLDKKYIWNVEVLDTSNKKVFYKQTALNQDGFNELVQVKKGTHFIKIYSESDPYSIKYISNKEYNIAYLFHTK